MFIHKITCFKISWIENFFCFLSKGHSHNCLRKTYANSGDLFKILSFEIELFSEIKQPPAQLCFETHRANVLWSCLILTSEISYDVITELKEFPQFRSF